MVNSSEVNAAPIHTSRQRTLVSGTIFNISANKTVVTAQENTKFADCSSTADTGTAAFKYLSPTERSDVITRETSSKNPMATTSPREKNRCARASTQKLLLLRSTFQMMFSASCSSLNAPDAPRIIASNPKVVASTPNTGRSVLAMINRIASSPCVPISAPNSCTISFCAARSPNTNPATDVATINTGASENSV